MAHVSENLRIVSLLPSATEIAVALGLGDQLVGRSHECDFPLWVERLPVCTATKLEKGLTSRQIDDRVKEIVRQGLSVYEVDATLIRSLRPDLILTQSQCAVCAVTPADLDEALAQWLGTPPVLLSLAPDTLGDVWDDIARVAEAAGVGERSRELIEQYRGRLQNLTEASDKYPSVAAIEWFDPLMVAGNWIPELIQLAGGNSVLARPGEHSPWIGWDALIDADPDVIVLMPCGYRISQSLADLDALTSRPEWRSLRAVRTGRVFVADGQYFFNRPGPRLVESAEMIAAMLCAQPGVDSDDSGTWIRLSAAVA